MNHVAFILKGYPRISETFIAQEIQALEKKGFIIEIFSLRMPREKIQHKLTHQIKAKVNYLPEYIYKEPLRFFISWVKIRKLTGYKTAKKEWVKDLKKDFTINRIRRFSQAIILAYETPQQISHLHSHFIHTPASVTYYASKILGVPFSISAHAKDIWTIKNWEKKQKIEAASWTVTCTKFNYEHLKSISPSSKIILVYHGLDFNRFPLKNYNREPKNGMDTKKPVILLSVGRLVEKKGYDILLSALSGIPKEINWKMEHIGDGPLNNDLYKLCKKLMLTEKINWNGTLTHEKVIKYYSNSDIFILASKVTRSGDRDGIPNVLMEAQSQALPCISTKLPSIEELIIDKKSGILVNSNSAKELSEAIIDLIKNPGKRELIGSAGQARLKNEFSMDNGILKLYALLNN